MIDLSQVTDIMLGNETVTQIEDSLGNVLWSAAPADEYFYVEDISGAANTLSIVKNNADAPTIEVFKSSDQTNWESMGNTDTTAITATVPANGKLYLKAVCDRWGNDTKYNSISCSGNYNVGGNSMSLLYGDNYENQTTFPTNNAYVFTALFGGDTHLKNAEDLKFPATTLAERCYYSMFEGCTGLTSAPALPATTVGSGCYINMFTGCTSLTSAPALPATTLAQSCYRGMFNNCTSLTTAPVLPATTMTTGCYREMFQNCTSLNTVTSYADDILATRCLTNWLNNVANTGDFYNLGSVTYPSGANGIPQGWTEHNSL